MGENYNQIEGREVAEIVQDGKTLKLYDQDGDFIAERGIYTAVKALAEVEDGSTASTISYSREDE